MCFFFTQLIEQQLLSLTPKISLLSHIIMFNLNCFITMSKFILISWQVWEKISRISFALHWSSDPQPRSKPLNVVYYGRGKWCYKPGRYAKKHTKKAWKVCTIYLTIMFLAIKDKLLSAALDQMSNRFIRPPSPNSIPNSFTFRLLHVNWCRTFTFLCSRGHN